MPHVTVKIAPGRTEEQKTLLASAIVQDLVAIANVREENLSVAIEEVTPEDWDAKVYQPEILPNRDKLYKKPAYDRPAVSKGRS